MYSKEDKRKGKEQFWTAFGRYMAAVPSADGDKINWVNYKTGIKHLHFRMDADQTGGNVFIEMTHPNEVIREQMYQTFKSYQAVFENITGEEWIWDPTYMDDYGKYSARIYRRLDKANLYNQEDWPSFISFFKPHIIAMDEFWSLAKDGFTMFK